MVARDENDGRRMAWESKEQSALFTVSAHSRSEVIHVVGKAQDTTKQTAMDQTRKCMKDTFSSVEITRLAPWEYHFATNLFEFDDEFYAIYGTNVAREGRFMAPDVYAEEFIHPDDAWIVEASVARALSFTERYFSGQYEHRIIRRDGEVRTIIVRSTVIKDATGKIIKYYGANQDITEQKVMEVALRASREKLSLAAELARLGPWEYNLETNLFEFNDEFYAIYGTNVEREGRFMAPDVYVREFVHPDDARRVIAEIGKHRHSKQLEHRIIRRDGEVRTIVVRISTLSNADGKIVRRYGANQDITEQKAMEEALRASGEKLSLAIELARLGPWNYDLETGLFEFNDEFYAIYGTSVARQGAFMAPDVYTREFVHPDDAWMVAAEVQKALTIMVRHHTAELEHRIIRRDGEIRTINVRINVIRDEAGKIIKSYGANQDITERKIMEEVLRQKTEEIWRMAYTDSLTGLSNRAYLNEKLKEELEKSHQGEVPGAVLFIDLDDLKTVNDTLGHTYGDIIIIEAGKRIAEEVGKDAFVGRVGGDEFLAILPGQKDRESIGRIVDRIVDVLCQDTEVFGEPFHISASVGVAIYPDDGDTAEEIFKNADNAMYAAKNAGKNCWRFYNSCMQVAAYEKMLLTKSLRHAIERGELLLHYQPQVAVVDGTTVGFEALLRWNSREHGSISPARFIPLAEQSGLIHLIGNWVLREACQFARRLADKGWGNIYVSVNISPHQLCADGFVCDVLQALKDAGIEPNQLELEITENALIVSLDESVCRLRELRTMGIRLALDDFGTGYSSLTYLQRLPVTTLKVDKSFVDMMLTKQKAIIRTIVDMAHAMEMSVVAEGVETKQQITYLAQCHCDIIQGYVFSRPVPEDDAIQFCPGVPTRRLREWKETI